VDRTDLQGYLDRGLSFEAIGRLIGLDGSTVAYRAHKHGLQSPHAERDAAKGSIPRERLEALVRGGLSIRAIASEVERGPTTVRHWLRAYDLRTDRPRDSLNANSDGAAHLIRYCKRHGTTEFVRTGTKGRYRCRRCRNEYRAERRRRVKRTLVEEACGHCGLCGYVGPAAAMHFHHRDPEAKAFNLSAQGVARSLSAARAEAAKCMLVRANCHAELEAPAPDHAGSPRSRAVVRRRRQVKAILVCMRPMRIRRVARRPAVPPSRPSDEETFGLSQAGVTRSLQRSREEARKCALLCANCHAEVEWAGASLTTVHAASPMHHNPG
jgi:Fe-S-cluster-containing hydrogenase component 2